MEGEPVTVLGGWDRRTQETFMMIEDEQGDAIYHSCFGKHNGEVDIEFFKSKFTQMKVSVPTSFFDQIEIDQQKNAGSRIFLYEQSGAYITR